MHLFPKGLNNSIKNGTDKGFASQCSISPNSMISFKLYVKMQFLNIFVTIHLGKGHVHSCSSGTLMESATPSLFSGVDSYI